MFANENNNDIHFLKDIVKKYPSGKNEKISMPKRNRSCCKIDSNLDERNLWVGKELSNIGDILIEKYEDKGLSLSIIKEIIFEVKYN